MNRFIKRHSGKLGGVAALVLVLSPYVALAQSTIPPAPPSPITTLYNPSGNTGILGRQGLLCRLFNFIFALLIVLAVLFGLWAGYQYLTSQGDMEKLRNARNTLIYGAAAVVVGLIAKGVPFIVTTFVAPGSPLNSAFGC